MPLKGILSDSNKFYLYNILLYSSIRINSLESAKITLDININSCDPAIIRTYVLQTRILGIANIPRITHLPRKLPHLEN